MQVNFWQAEPISRWIDRLLPVHPSVVESERTRARALAGLVLFIVVIVTMSNIVMWLIGALNISHILGVISAFTIYGLLFVVPYRRVAHVAVVLISVQPLIVLGLTPESFTTPNAVYPMLIAIMIAALFTSISLVLQMVLLTGFLIVGIYMLGGIATLAEVVSWITGLLAVGALFAVGQMLQNFEQQRQQRLIDRTRRSNAHYHQLNDMLPDAIIIHGQQRILYANRAALALFGLPDFAALRQHNISHFFQSSASSRFRINHRDQTLVVQYEDEITPHDSKQSVPVDILATTITFEDQLSTMMVLRAPVSEYQNAFKLAAQHSSDSIIITDTNLDDGPHIQYVNAAFCEMTGYEPQNVIGRTPRILQGPATEPGVLADLASDLEAGVEQTSGQTINYRRDGTPFTVAWTIYPLRETDGSVQGYLSLQREVKAEPANDSEMLELTHAMISGYRYLLDVVPDGTVRFAWLHGAVEAISGYDEARLKDYAGWRNLIHADDLEKYHRRQQALLDGEQQMIEYRLMRPDGSVCWVQDTARPIRDAEDKPVRQILGVVQDITDRVEAQRVLKAHVVQQAVVAELGLLAMTILEPDELLRHAAILCQQVLEVDYCAIFEHRARASQFVCRATSHPDRILPNGFTFSDGRLLSQAGYALYAAEPVMSVDFLDETRFQPLKTLIEANLHSSLSAVILGHTAPFGVISVYGKDALHFSSDDTYFLQSISNVIGTFFERSRAQLAERSEREFAEALRDATSVINMRLSLKQVLDEILKYVFQVVPKTETASIMLRDNDSNELRFISLHGFDPAVEAQIKRTVYDEDQMPLIKRMRETERVLNLPDVANEPLWYRTNHDEVIASYLGAPVIVQDQCIGYLHLNSLTLAAFNERDENRLQTFADKIGTAIVNARYANQLEKLVHARTQELKNERERIEAIIAGTGDGVLYTEGGVIAYVNQSLCDMSGYTVEELIGSPDDLLQPDELQPREVQHLEKRQETLDAGDTWRSQMRLQRKDGTLFEAGLTVSKVGDLPDEDGLYIVTLVRDISREKALEDLKSRFIATAAHELRSPITSLQTRMYMIRRQPEKLEYHLERLSMVIARANRLVGDLLDVAAFESGHITLRQSSIILQEVCVSVIDMIHAEAEFAQLTLSADLPDEPVHVWADPHRMEQVLTNLITNAIHYTPPEGTIKLVMRVVPDQSAITLAVSDSGEGIKPEDIGNIFRPFYRAENNTVKGTGLGLSITREIIELHDGTIEVESELGGGTTFTITLPLLTDA